MPDPTQNTGIIYGYRASDYAGGTLPYEVLNESGDWTQYLPPGEWQRINALDVMACVSFSALNVLETLYFFLTGTQRNFSDRFTARMSGTTSDGNWLWKVGDSIRKDGLVDEIDWAWTNSIVDWDTYYANPPMDVINKAKEFLKEWEVKYEFIDFSRDSLIYHLKQSPIQVVFPNHAVMNFFTADQVYKYFDSYAPFIKDRSDGFTSATKYVLRKKENMDPLITAGKDIYRVKNGKKDLFLNSKSFIALDGRWNEIVTKTQAELDAIPDGDVLIAVSNE